MLFVAIIKQKGRNTFTMSGFLAILGSGETGPSMVSIYEYIFAKCPYKPKTACILCTPYWFQENALQISDRISAYFASRFGIKCHISGSTNGGKFDFPKVYDDLKSVDLIFSGPGSPTYALKYWRGTPLRDVILKRLSEGAVVVFSSAAALTLGDFTLPVYEIYKAGADPYWESGIGITSVFGLKMAIIPHYNNAEGNGYDTSCCYVGKKRLQFLEKLLPESTAVIGIDEHTALIYECDARTFEIKGLGEVTLRRNQSEWRWQRDMKFPLEALSGVSDGPHQVRDERESVATIERQPSEPNPFSQQIREIEQVFEKSLYENDIDQAIQVILRLDELIETAELQGTASMEELDYASPLKRSMILHIGKFASEYYSYKKELDDLVEAILSLRRKLRENKMFKYSDYIREVLNNVGIEVMDTKTGYSWKWTR